MFGMVDSLIKNRTSQKPKKFEDEFRRIMVLVIFEVLRAIGIPEIYLTEPRWLIPQMLLKVIQYVSSFSPLILSNFKLHSGPIF